MNLIIRCFPWADHAGKRRKSNPGIEQRGKTAAHLGSPQYPRPSRRTLARTLRPLEFGAASVACRRRDGDADGAKLGRARAGRHCSRHRELGMPSSSHRPAPRRSSSTLVILPEWSYLLSCAAVSVLGPMHACCSTKGLPGFRKQGPQNWVGLGPVSPKTGWFLNSKFKVQILQKETG
jgi:hypothetical protein